MPAYCRSFSAACDEPTYYADVAIDQMTFEVDEPVTIGEIFIFKRSLKRDIYLRALEDGTEVKAVFFKEVRI